MPKPQRTHAAGVLRCSYPLPGGVATVYVRYQPPGVVQPRRFRWHDLGLFTVGIRLRYRPAWPVSALPAAKARRPCLEPVACGCGDA